MQEDTVFEKDSTTTAAGKNRKLAKLLASTWLGLNIVKIERIEIGTQRGWLATHRF